MTPKKIHPNEISETFCVLPWIHLSTRPNGHLRLCCTANASSAGATNDKKYGGEVGILKNPDGKPANLGQVSLLEAWNNDYMKSTRLKMLRGEAPASCLKCFKEEKAGHRSKRIWETEYWSQRLDVEELLKRTTPEGEVPPHIAYIDLRLGTKCNLKCIMCSPHDSSQWVVDWRKMHPEIQNPSLRETMQWNNNGKVDGASYNWFMNNPGFWDELDRQLPNLQQLYFAGGESTIIEEHYSLLEKCIASGDAPHIELRYNSNGIELPERLFELWSRFKRVRFHFSIDSIFEMNHYNRYPSPWERIESQLRRLDQTDSKVEVTVACAVQILNIYYIPDFIRWKMERGFKKINPWPLGAGMINFHLVYHPAHLNVKVLPPEFKDRVARKYEEFYVWLRENHPDPKGLEDSGYGLQRLKGLVSFMMSEDWSNRLPEFQEYIRIMDRVRGLDFGRVFPEMKELVP
ncbi:MAG TPA: twitch domain-containing radical SAM protein [Pseudobdellovibrionaceae bacterium]|nr:twitch domain-containing radical SAM protein [Pseudobdellovibrionaceae bacterium]